MIKYYVTRIVAVAILMSSFSSKAQTSQHPIGIEINGGLMEYQGDLGSALFFAKKPIYGGAGLNVGMYINKNIDVMIYGGSGDVGFYSELPYNWPYPRYAGFRSRIINAQMGLRYKLNNGTILKEDAKLAPFVQAGWGGIQYISRINYVASNLVDYSGLVSGGAGFTYNVASSFALRVTSVLNYTFNDIWDGHANIDNFALVHKRNKNNDVFMYHSVGLVFQFGKGSEGGEGDKDKDGVIDRLDKCKRTPLGYAVDADGCPLDTDNDSINDNFDRCPNDSGPRKYNGCPDTDGDTIVDKDDQCPKVAGPVEFKGCPDNDGDGVADKDDHCPTVAGLKQFAGCPDRDGDGIEDHIDKCPDHKGTAEGEGCPDTDGDGVFDHVDRCPNKAGTIENKGCPEIKAEVKAKIALAAKGINFETASDVIKAESFDDLENLIKLLNEFPEAKVEIQGHTDNTGVKDAIKRATNNKDLSQRRANSVMAYLTSNGIAAERLTAVGYGEEKPIADNGSAAGKAKNRRVDFVLTY